MDVSDLVTVQVVALVGSKLLIKEMPDYPFEDCDALNCYELAEYCVFLVNDSGVDHTVSYRCEEHKDEILDLISKGVPAHSGFN